MRRKLKTQVSDRPAEATGGVEARLAAMEEALNERLSDMAKSEG